AGHHGPKGGGERRLKENLTRARRVVKRQGTSVQHLPSRACDHSAPVEFIAHKRMPQARQVHTYLVRATRFQAAYGFGDRSGVAGPSMTQRLIMRDGGRAEERRGG